ncbi:N-acetylmuramoyl-L-alanine amidase [Flavobacterium sp.]|uniref:N-acetylmuramoyl-L-alanine amidase n=1 Tax=Flavobacterium sp. TaxID=239 RepID=UPI0025C24CF6|nr:N-acetylmuramoyl-L-alanine amidase [Flavobacterium sp.]
MLLFTHRNIFLLLLSFCVFTAMAQKKNAKFTVVLDAGHGGKDPGNSYHGFVEKEIALKTTLKVGDLLEKQKDFEVVYTRQTDVFIELVNRPKVANKINADLFVSIHCNSVTNQTPAGTETFVMGLSRSNMNLEVAKKENSVILLEDNYKKTYEGFDPNKPESLAGLKIKQEDNLNSSITLASIIQDNFTNNLSRKTRGVKQQPLWVLDAAYMPGVLIELGFLSNKEEGEYLNSEEGQDQMAEQIAKAIMAYKKDFFSENASVEEDKPIVKPPKPAKEEVKEITKAITQEVAEVKQSDTVVVPTSENGKYKIQLFASSKKRDVTSPDFKGLKAISFTFDNNLYKYFYGSASDLNEAKKLCQEAKKSGFSDAFVVVIKDGKTVAVK